jgi:23S rRNA (cytosine1962-C5)-methyltransferase
VGRLEGSLAFLVNGERPPCVVFEDADLLAVHKPAGMNTHAPSPHAGEGIYEWLRAREPRWSCLAIIHRLDKETSGLLVFGKTTAANRSLTQQFESRSIEKRYLLWTDRPVRENSFEVKTGLRRAGENYVVTPLPAGDSVAETRFSVVERRGAVTVLAAEPRTGKTHQIRVHAAHLGFPILGDTLYGGTAADRVFLHAEQLRFLHPITRSPVSLKAAADFDATKSEALRRAVIDPAKTTLHRAIHGESDGHAGWYVDRVGEFLLSQSESPLSPARMELLQQWSAQCGARGAYHKILRVQPGIKAAAAPGPELVLGRPAPDEFAALENGVKFRMSFQEGYSIGLFFDQRDNRRRLLTRWVAPEFSLSHVKTVCNAFAYTCGFSVCAALAGATTTSIDLSRKYLEWGKRNFAENGVDPATHDFIDGDIFDWFKRFAKKNRRFDLVMLDPPTFSRSREHGVFQVEKDFGTLVKMAVALLNPDGVLFCSTNSARLEPERFLRVIDTALTESGRRPRLKFYAPQPTDFPVSRGEPAYLKTVWVRM